MTGEVGAMTLRLSGGERDGDGDREVWGLARGLAAGRRRCLGPVRRMSAKVKGVSDSYQPDLYPGLQA